MAIPPLRADGFLPEGVHPADVEEVRQHFGTATPRRRELMQRVELWVELACLVGAKRLLLNGSFVTKKRSPNDVDAVMLLPSDFGERLRMFDSVAFEIQDCLCYRYPAELFAAWDAEGLQKWITYFARVRRRENLCKGMVEVLL